MGAARYVKLNEAEDGVLRELELGKGIHQKVRLRASILRLSNQGWSVGRLSSHFGRSQKSVLNDLDRWQRGGIQGLANKPQVGNNRVMTTQMEGYLQQQLAEERAWDCSQLAEALYEKFGVAIKREALRVRLISLGYSWQRSRYEPGKEPDPQEVKRAQENIETLKRGQWKNG